MADWKYVREERTKITEGDYRLSIVDAQEAVSQSSGNRMIVLTVQPNGSDIKIHYYIVYNEYFNRNMTQFYDSFNIEEGDFNLLTWVGAVGAGRLKLDDQGYLKVAWFINKDKAQKLPEWVGEMPERQTVTDLDGFKDVSDDDENPF